jgi:anti-sigma28 factor (negative regulator of flagellin synthesis)
MAQVAKYKPIPEKNAEIRLDKVVEISKRIKNGTYFTGDDVDRVASGLAELFMEDYFDGI